jgi:hypothetical protein
VNPILTETALSGKRWTVDGKLHRTDGPAIIRANGNEHWYCCNLLHRIDGPALVFTNGYEAWWLHGKRHSEVAPAVFHSGLGLQEWFLHGVNLSLNDWLDRNTIMTDEEKVLYKLQHG